MRAVNTARSLAAALAMACLAAWAAPPAHPAPGETWQDPVSGITFCYCPPGTYQMGTVEEEPYQETNQKPRHPVILSRGFWLGRAEVTERQWFAVMGSLPPLPEWADAMRTGTPRDEALTDVSWSECQEYLGRLDDQAGGVDYRLPTEAEWEYACEAGTPPEPDQAWGTIGRGLQPVVPNAWGLLNMLGPVGEWCSDWAGPYPAGPVTDPQGPGQGRYRVSRGGLGFQAKHIHPTWRWFYTPGFKYEDLGLRVVRAAD